MQGIDCHGYEDLPQWRVFFVSYAAK